MKYTMRLVLLVMFINAPLHLLQAQWIQINNGLPSLSVRCLAVSPDGSNIFAGFGEGSNVGVFHSTNNGTSWTEANTGLTNMNVNALATSGTNIFAGTWGGGVFLSTNNGTSWTVINNGLTSTTLKIFSFAVSGTNIFAATWKDGVFLSTNNGTNWTSVGLVDINVYAFAVSGTNIFAGCSDGVSGGGVYLSTNNGTNWIQVNNGLTNIDLRYIDVLGTNLFAGTSGGGVFLSTNNGISWNAVNTGLTNMNIYSLAVSGSNIFAGTWGSGVFLSTNNGTNWTNVSGGLTGNFIMYLTASSTNLFAGTYFGSGVWRRQLSELITSVALFSNNQLADFILGQNYPNPFNPSTKISWQSAVSSWQTLKVFDVLGREVATLVNEEKPAGIYEVEFSTGSFGNASGLASGVYTYTLTVGEFISSKKMVFLK